MNILVTGSAGFIGFHLSKRLLKEGYNVIGFDNFNPYYDVQLKERRNQELESIATDSNRELKVIRNDLENTDSINNLFKEFKPNIVVNLAAQAGVRYSLENPKAYLNSNVIGFGNILEACRHNDVEHLIYASSSSVYGGNKNLPFSESHSVDHPVSLYAATKKSNELMAHTYSHLFGLPATGLRFFTVYGPWGRPDMALFKFTKSILSNEPIEVFNKGNMIRDFTYIDDIIESIFRLIKKPQTANTNFNCEKPDPATSWAPHRLFNIGNSSPTNLMDYITAIEESLGLESKKIMLPMQPGDVTATAANTSLLEDWVDFKPSTSINVGVNNFINWYKDFYNL
tara:strand:+ start:4981 stop:6003 length:1023 start_codon:yes stop_codon:yes gene_type:complete